jgi:RNA polymerase sigma-70 factor, ECF subfamily
MKVDVEDIYKKYSKFVYNVSLKILNNNKNDAEDVLQEVFIKLHRNNGSFENRSTIKTFIYRMAVNQSIDLIKRQQSQSDRAEKSCITLGNRISDGSMLLDNLMSHLNGDQRAVVVLYEIAGYTQKEIAKLLDMRYGTVSSILCRSLKKMMKIYREEA